MFRIKLLATGGTLEKTYDPEAQALTLERPGLQAVLAQVPAGDAEIEPVRLMALDSLDMTATDIETIADAVSRSVRAADAEAIIVTHGTDKLAQTARELAARRPTRPVVVTGAMIPAAVTGSDAVANLAQAVLACRVLAPGAHVVFHGRAMAGDRVEKDHARATIVEKPA